MATSNELRQVNSSLFEVVSRGNELPDPVDLTLAEIAEEGAAYESMLISVRRLDIETNDETFAAARTYAITDGTAEAGTVDFRTPRSGDDAIIGRAVPDSAFDCHGHLCVAVAGGPTNQSALLKFAPGADGNVPPIAIILSQLSVPGEVAGTNTRL